MFLSIHAIVEMILVIGNNNYQRLLYWKFNIGPLNNKSGYSEIKNFLDDKIRDTNNFEDWMNFRQEFATAAKEHQPQYENEKMQRNTDHQNYKSQHKKY